MGRGGGGGTCLGCLRGKPELLFETIGHAVGVAMGVGLPPPVNHLPLFQTPSRFSGPPTAFDGDALPASSVPSVIGLCEPQTQPNPKWVGHGAWHCSSARSHPEDTSGLAYDSVPQNALCLVGLSMSSVGRGYPPPPPHDLSGMRWDSGTGPRLKDGWAAKLARSTRKILFLSDMISGSGLF